MNICKGRLIPDDELNALSINTLFELVEPMRPVDRTIASMRFARLSYDIIGKVMGLSKQAVQTRMTSITADMKRRYTAQKQQRMMILDLLPSDKPRNVLHHLLAEYLFSVRATYCFNKMGLVTIHDLCNVTVEDLRSVVNVGPITVNEIKDFLTEYGLSLT